MSIHDLRANPDYQRARFNIFRRIWQAPWNFIEFNILRSFMSKEYAYFTRFMTTRFGMGYLGLIYVAYYMQFRADSWETMGGPKLYTRKRTVLPGDPEWPEDASQQRLHDSDYADRGFKHSPI